MRLGSILFLCAAAGLVSMPSNADSKKKFLSTPDGSITAYFDGPQCDTKIQLLFEGNSEDAFKEGVTPASRLMKNATRVMSRQCESVERIVSKGVFEDRILYNGIAEAATDWELTEIGVRSSGVAVSASTEAGEQEKFVADDAFVSVSDIVETVDGNTYCANPDDANTCLAETTFAQAEEGLEIKARYLVDDDGVEAIVTYPGVATDGVACSATDEVSIDVEGGNLSDDGRVEYAEQLRERLISGGESSCFGFHSSDEQLSLTNFDAEGRQLGEPLILLAETEDITLRLEE